jgi:hypothetical protein
LLRQRCFARGFIRSLQFVSRLTLDCSHLVPRFPIRFLAYGQFRRWFGPMPRRPMPWHEFASILQCVRDANCLWPKAQPILVPLPEHLPDLETHPNCDPAPPPETPRPARTKLRHDVPRFSRYHEIVPDKDERKASLRWNRSMPPHVLFTAIDEMQLEMTF